MDLTNFFANQKDFPVDRLKLNDPIPFGKHKGKSIKYLADEMPDYMSWVMNQTGLLKLESDALLYVMSCIDTYEEEKSRSQAGWTFTTKDENDLPF